MAMKMEISESVFKPTVSGDSRAKVDIQGLSVYYGKFRALADINLSVHEKRITAIIGPSGCGKSTLLRSFNRMNDLTPGCRMEGEIYLDGENVLSSGMDVVDVRRRVGMVFQRPNPFPKSIFDNVAYGPRLYGIHNRSDLESIVEHSLKSSALWNEVKDKLNQSGLSISGGQQQRLCIARALAVEPEVILMDEPASALDPISTLKIEELMQELKQADGNHPDLDELLDLVALGTVADLAPLVGENRVLVRSGLQKLRQTKRQGLFSLAAVSDLPLARITAASIGYVLGLSPSLPESG